MSERRNATRLRGFTLVELLVVVAIIALLLALLLPQLARAKSLTRMALCAHHLSQINTGFATMAGGADPYGRTSAAPFPGRTGWPLNPYSALKSRAVFRCPEDQGRPGLFVPGLQYKAGFKDGDWFYEFRDAYPGGPYGYPMVRGRTGNDADGPYTEYVCEENWDKYDVGGVTYTGGDFWDRRPWYPNSPDYSDNDGVFRFYENADESLTVKIQYYTCGGANEVWLMGQRLWTGDFMRANVGKKFKIWAVYTSYGINTLLTRKNRVAAETVVLTDYDEHMVDMDHPADVYPQHFLKNGQTNTGVVRHLGKVNVLFADGSVRQRYPSQIRPDTHPELWSTTGK